MSLIILLGLYFFPSRPHRLSESPKIRSPIFRFRSSSGIVSDATLPSILRTPPSNAVMSKRAAAGRWKSSPIWAVSRPWLRRWNHRAVSPQLSTPARKKKRRLFLPGPRAFGKGESAHKKEMSRPDHQRGTHSRAAAWIRLRARSAKKLLVFTIFVWVGKKRCVVAGFAV